MRGTHQATCHPPGWSAGHGTARAGGAVADPPWRRVSAMAVQQFSVIVEWDAEDEAWVTHVPTLDHLSTYGETRQAALDNT
ncbi:MAG: type II toxin-antitoxin system HicB family antitoxin, partial [Acidobacteria bacterium]|nr:type II toxin-antitoxin system HicB family antitoxin [Acidobacteriota bacterium]